MSRSGGHRWLHALRGSGEQTNRLYERHLTEREFDELQTIVQSGEPLLAARGREAGVGQGVAAPGLAADRARVAAAQSRREARARAGRESARLLAGESAAHRGDPVRGLPG